MKSLSVFVCATALAATTNLALAGFDGTGTISTSAISALPGGEFTITPATGYLGETGLAADLSSGSFQTFCMEVNEHFSPGGTYGMNINTVSILGGSGGPTYILDPRTAFLYSNFRHMTLTGYDYTLAGRQASAGQLQAAIWFIQGGQSGGANNAFVALADAAILSGAWSGIGDVRVLNVYGLNGALGQDQLTIVPTPGAGALLGLATLAIARRRR